MLPVTSTITPLPVQTTLVATTLPGNNTLRVPVTNVAPSVSNAQINNNTQGGGNAVVAEEEVVAQAAAPVVTEEEAAFSARANTGYTTGAPATFLAQLMGQNTSPEAQGALRGVLAGYEKMVSLNYVKYKPSNATLPEPAPSGLFGKMLQEENSHSVQQVQAPVSVVAATAQTHAAAPPAPIAVEPVHKVSASDDDVPAAEGASSSEEASAPANPIPSAIRAYAAVISRNNISIPKADAAESV